MKYTPEYLIPLAFKAHLEAALDTADFALWPVVTWFDPMAIDDGNRVVCLCLSARTSDTQPGNFTADVEIGVRTEWTQPTIATDVAAHFDRVAQVRDVLSESITDLTTDLAAQCAAGITITYVDAQREFTTEVNEGNYFSNVKLSVECHATTEA